MAKPITSDLADLFPDAVTVRTPTADGTTGDRTVSGSGTSRRCRCRGKVQMVRGEDGQERVSTVQVTFAGSFGLTILDEYTLPSRFAPQRPRPIAVQTISDENGPHHQVVYF